MSKLHQNKQHPRCAHAAVKNSITAGLRKANITLGYTNSTPSFAFLCPCGVGEPHPATIGDEFWICTADEDVGEEFSPNQTIWLESSTTDSQTGMVSYFQSWL